jgi:hypothetical protein
MAKVLKVLLLGVESTRNPANTLDTPLTSFLSEARRFA